MGVGVLAPAPITVCRMNDGQQTVAQPSRTDRAGLDSVKEWIRPEKSYLAIDFHRQSQAFLIDFLETSSLRPSSDTAPALHPSSLDRFLQAGFTSTISLCQSVDRSIALNALESSASSFADETAVRPTCPTACSILSRAG